MNHPHPQDFNSWMRSIEQRVGKTERRPAGPVPTVTSPGITGAATEISDWNSDAVAYNGFFFAQIGSVNSPDPTKAWMGYSIADPDGLGFQRITVYRDPANEGSTNPFPGWPGATYSRNFYSQDGSSRAYSSWVAEGGGGGAETYYLTQGADVNVTTGSLTAITDLTQTVTSASSDTWMVTACLAVSHLDTTSKIFAVSLRTPSIQNATAVWNPGANAWTNQVVNTWLVSGLSGSHTLSIWGSLDSSGSTYKVLGGVSTMSVVKLA